MTCDFVWRQPDASPFLILISEMLLRKTRAETVDPVVRQLLGNYPTPAALASAEQVALTKLLRPLGLHRVRAAALIGTMQSLLVNHGGEVPADEASLLALPHVGRYAANAVLCFAFGQRRPVVDANVTRVFHRIFGIAIPAEIHRADHLWAFAETMLPRSDVKRFNWALLDFGRLACTARSPRCAGCPFRDVCLAWFRKGKFINARSAGVPFAPTRAIRRP